MRIASVRALAIDCGFQTQALQTTRVASPMSRWERFAEQRASWMWPSKKVIVRIESEDGVVGWGCTNGGEVVALIIERHLGPLIEQSVVSDTREVWEQMFCSLLPHGQSGFSMMAIAGVDIALWDLLSKTAGEPLGKLLGGAKAKLLAVYATTPSPEAGTDSNWWGLKAPMPHGPTSGDAGLEENVALIAAFRQAAGPGRHVMLDAFMAWDVDYTLKFMERAAHLGLYWVEDPIPSHDVRGLERIKRQAEGRTRLALGNFAFSRWDCALLCREGVVDVLQPDVAWVGGITECLRIFDIAEAANVPVILHNTCEQPWAMALAASRDADAVVEWVDRGKTSPLYSLMGSPTKLENGRAIIPDDVAGNTPSPEIAAQFDAAAAHPSTSTRR